jgi:hypothetical protein
MNDYTKFDHSGANTPVSAGCWQCGTFCPWTDETEPPLTKELSDMWFEAHRDVCPAPDDDPIIGTLMSSDDEI